MKNCQFEFIEGYKDKGLTLPQRKTTKAAGYDFMCAEDTVIPSLANMTKDVLDNINVNIQSDEYINIATMEELTKQSGFRPTLVPTGVKCKIPDGYYLQLSVRSSTPLKTWLVLANSIGNIDADYYNNVSNEGHIYFQVMNLSPFNIQVKKGDIIGQGIILPYEVTEDDNPGEERTGGFGSTSK